MKFKIQLKTNPGAHVQSRTPFVEFDLGQIFQLKTNAGASMHIQSQTQFFEFDLSLNKTQQSTRNQSSNACAKSNSIF